MVTKASSLAKLARPVLTRVFPRERRFDLLDRLRQQPVIWISGPAGCGKTTLASSYIETRQLPCLWYRLDRGDGDAATFFYYLALAARKVSPRVKRPLPLLTPEYLQGLSTFTLRYFENLYQRLRRPSILVFDNYQEVPPDAYFHEIILQGLSNTPEGINIFLISRQAPPAGLVRLEANQQMGFLPWSELRLTLEESTGIAAVRFPDKLPRRSLHQLHSIADGWAAGVILLLERLKREKMNFKQLGKLVREEIFDYFSKEILNPLDPETRDFLLKTALLPQMTEGMAEKLTGQIQAGRTLARLNRGNYFIEKRVLEEPIYGYHPLFQEFLLSKAQETLSRKDFSFFRRQAAEILEDHGQVESAVRLLQEIGDWETLIQLVLKHAPVLHAQGRYSVLVGWLRSLPPGWIESRPWLAYWMGSCLMFADPAQSRPYFEQAYRQLRKEKDAAGIYMAWSGMMDAINLGYGFESFSALDRHLQELEEIRRDYPVFPSAEIEARVASAVVAALTLRQPNHPEFESWAERALRLAQDQTVVNMRNQSLFFLAYYHLYGGTREKALLAINQLRQMSQSPHASAYSKILTNMAEAMHYCIVGLSRESMKAAQTGVELSQRSGILFTYHGFLAFAGFAAFQMNDLQAGRNFLKQMTSCEHHLKPFDTTYYYLLKANEALVSGEVRQAHLHADLALKKALDIGSPALTIRCHLAKARALAEIGSRTEATKQLKQAADLSRQMKIGFGEFCCLFTRAQFDFDGGEERTAWMTLRKALRLGKERGFMGIYIDRPASTARVCMKALEAGIEVDYIREMIRERNLMPEQPPWHLENWPWPLEIFTLGRFAILKDGKLIRFTRKVQQKPLAMLKALIALGGKEVEEEQISDILWPEADGDMAHQSWATTLHRLRHWLGEEKAIQRHEGRLTLDDTHCWVDMWAFEHLLAQAEAQWKEGRKDGAVKLTEKAVELYKGTFLGQKSEEPWAMSPSERLRTKFFRGVKRIGLFCQEREEWEKAIDCYQKGLEVDHLAEEFYQGIMTCYQRLGRRSEALLVYSRCKKELSTALGVTPSPKTESIHREILSGIH